MANSSSSKPLHHENHHLYVERRAFVAVWFVVFLFHAAMAAYCVVLYKLYVFFGSDYFYNYVGVFSKFTPHDLLVVSRCFAAAASLFVVPMTMFAVASVRDRELSFQTALATQGNGKTTWPALRRVYRSLDRLVHVVGPEGAYFEDFTLASEISEIATETYQAYRVSHSVPDASITNVSAFFLVANCWSTPLVHWFLARRGKIQYKRVAIVVLDALLDMGWSVVVPVAIFYPFYTMYDPETSDLVLDDEEASVTWAMEAPLLIVTKWIDLGAMILPLVSIASSLSHIAALVRPKKRAVAPTGPEFELLPKAYEPYVAPSASTRTSSTLGTRLLSSIGTFAKTSKASCLSRATRHRLLVKWGDRFFIAWGVIVLSAQVTAMAIAWHGADSGCGYFVRPWFSAKLACSIVTVDCYRPGLTADTLETTFGSMIGGFDKTKLTSLTIVNCGAIRMPSGFAELNGLSTLTLFNISALDWPADVAISEASKPALATMYIYCIGFTEVPAGLLQPFPAGLYYAQFISTNISVLPAEIATLWASLAYLDFERSLLQEVPASVAAMGLTRLSVMFNDIQELPFNLLDAPANLMTLAVAQNPLKALPESSAAFPGLLSAYFDNTQVTTLPKWLQDPTIQAQLLVAYATGSPYCSTSEAANYPKIECTETSIRSTGFGDIAYFEENYGVV